MLIGCCASMIAPEIDPIGVEAIEPLAEIGYDYIELSLSHLTALREDDFFSAEQRLRKASLPCLACNNFFPPSIRLTGSQISLKASITYAEAAIIRASQIGAKIIVFGSSGAKNVPFGFSTDQAWAQIRELLQCIGPIASHYDMMIAIEPISRPESNLVLTAAEGLKLMHEVNQPSIKLLVDYYHLTTEKESDSIIQMAGDAIRHLHLATSGDRRFPVTTESIVSSGIKPFLESIKALNYFGGISIEAYTNSFRQDAVLALEHLRSWLSTHTKTNQPNHERP